MMFGLKLLVCKLQSLVCAEKRHSQMLFRLNRQGMPCCLHTGKAWLKYGQIILSEDRLGNEKEHTMHKGETTRRSGRAPNL